MSVDNTDTLNVSQANKKIYLLKLLILVVFNKYNFIAVHFLVI